MTIEALQLAADNWKMLQDTFDFVREHGGARYLDVFVGWSETHTDWVTGNFEG